MNKILEVFDTKPLAIIIDNQVKNYVKDLILECDIGKKFLIVCDLNTYEVLGKKIEYSLKCLNARSYIIAQNQPKADIKQVQNIKQLSKNYDAIIAVGSGTVNDLCKYASFLNNMPYIVFATAPSMNGYCSANASISFDGFKNTVKAHLPKALFCDIDILCEAPTRLIQSGLGDSICRPTAQADWLLSHILLDTKYNEKPFQMLKEYEPDLFANSADLIKGSGEIVGLLMKTLIASGLGMYLAASSAPASQGEHMIAHTMEMGFNAQKHSFHGEQIAVTTHFMIDLIEKNFENTPKFLVQPNIDLSDIFSQETNINIKQEYRNKLQNVGDVDEFNQKLERKWSEIIGQISNILIDKNEIVTILSNANISLLPESIGWNLGNFKTASEVAKYTRNRFGFLDFINPV